MGMSSAIAQVIRAQPTCPRCRTGTMMRDYDDNRCVSCGHHDGRHQDAPMLPPEEHDRIREAAHRVGSAVGNEAHARTAQRQREEAWAMLQEGKAISEVRIAFGISWRTWERWKAAWRQEAKGAEIMEARGERRLC